MFSLFCFFCFFRFFCFFCFLCSCRHPGNLLVRTQPNGEPQLALIDFGLTVAISQSERAAMTGAIYHLLTRDFSTLIKEDTKTLGFLEPDFDTTELEPILENVIKMGVEGGSDMRKRRRQFREISGDLNAIFFQYPFTVPAFFALITRGLGLLEGIALKGDENFDIFNASYPFAMKAGIQLGYGELVARRKEGGWLGWFSSSSSASQKKDLEKK